MPTFIVVTGLENKTKSEPSVRLLFVFGSTFGLCSGEVNCRSQTEAALIFTVKQDVIMRCRF